MFWTASVLFFLSGATGLAYEVIWFKRFSHVWGNSTLAMAAVVASFLFGLGLGAYRLGRTADRAESPLRWYSGCEAGIGLLAIAIPVEISFLLPLSAGIQASIGTSPVLHSLVRFAFTFVVLGPACFLMGGTLPLLIRHFLSPSLGLERSAAWFYAVNTLGAATGCYLTGFHLLPALGLSTSNALTAGLNLTIAVAAVVLARYSRPDPQPGAHRESTTVSEPVSHDGRGRGLWLAVAATGCAALILEVVWTRQLALILGGSTYAFTAMLFVVLVGIGAGSLAFRLVYNDAKPVFYGPSVVIAALVASAVIGRSLTPVLASLAGTTAPLRSAPGVNAALSVAASAALELLPTFAMGILFPLFIHLARDRSAAGATVGRVYAWNTAGTILGATVTPLFLIPSLGTETSITIGLWLYVIAALVLSPAGPPRKQLGRLAICLLAALAVLGSPGARDPRILNSGMYLYGYTRPETLVSRSELLFFEEGSSSNVLVTKTGDHHALRVNGKVDASDRTDMGMQLGLAYFPRFLFPEARNALVIGFGSGTTSGATLLFPGTEVTVCEIEPAVFRARDHFAHVNHRPANSPGFSIVFDDARSHLQSSETIYDLILSEPSNPWIAGVSNLFTREFYDTVKTHLRPGGIFAQWIQTYSFSESDYALVVRTLMSVFPHYGLVRITDGDTILLASSSPLTLDLETLRRAQSQLDSLPVVQSDLRTYFGTTELLPLMLTHYLLDDEGLRRLVSGDENDAINSDVNMRLEFEAPRHLFLEVEDSRRAVGRYILSAVDLGRLADRFYELGGSNGELAVFRQIEAAFLSSGLPDLALRAIEAGLRRAPEQPELLAERLVLSETDEATFEAALSTILASSESLANRVGVALSQARRYGPALRVFERLTILRPASMMAWNNLALTYAGLGRRDEAVRAFQTAIDLDPFNEVARRSFEAYQAQAPGAVGATGN